MIKNQLNIYNHSLNIDIVRDAAATNGDKLARCTSRSWATDAARIGQTGNKFFKTIIK